MDVTRMRDSSKKNGYCHLRLDGDVDIYNVEESRKLFSNFVENYNQFKLDLGSVAEIDSAGLQLLLQFRRKAEQSNGEVQLVNCSEAVMQRLRVLGLQDLTTARQGESDAN